jgi:DNA-binding NarL/FixJ family response regulator
MGPIGWSHPLVGRDFELAALRRGLAQARTGTRHAVLVLADAGMGKTRLADELLARERSRVTGLLARGQPFGGTASFGLWTDALEPRLRGLETEEITQLCGGVLDDLATLLRSVAAIRGGAPRKRPRREHLLEGLAVLVGNLAAHEPLVVVLDDVHLADASSIDVIDHLLRDRAPCRLLVVLTARPAELAEQPTTSRTLLRLQQDGVLEEVRLGALGPQALRRLADAVLAATATDSLVAWLETRSRGNPLFAIGLLQALVDEGADLAAPVLRRLPENLNERIRAAFDGLDPRSRDLLEALAVLGAGADLAAVGALDDGGSPGELAVALERLSRSGLIVERELGSHLTFEIAHPLIQEALYNGVGAARRRVLHRAVGRRLLASGSFGAAAPHYARSADPGDAEAIEALLEAEHQAEERQSHREALTILEALLELLPSGDRRWLRVLDSMAGPAEWVVDHRADSDAATGIRVMRELASLLGAEADKPRLATVQFRLSAFLAWGSDDQRAAEEAGLRALELSQAAGDEVRALLATNELGWIRGLSGDLPAQRAAARAVLAAAERRDDPLVAMQALGSLGHSTLQLGDFQGAVAAFDRSARIAERQRRPYRLTWSRSLRAYALALAGQMTASREGFAQAVAEDAGDRDTILVELRAFAHWLGGDLGAAIAAADESASSSGGRLSRRRAWVMGVAAAAATELGDLAEARGRLERAEQVYAGREFYLWSHLCVWASGVVNRRVAGPAAAVPALQRAAAALGDMGAVVHATFVLVDLAEAAAELGDIQIAAAAAERATAMAEALRCAPYTGLADLASAWAAWARGDVAATVELADGAVVSLEAAGWRLLHARAMALGARASLEVDPRLAAARLAAAAEALRSCSARDRSEAVLADLRALGQDGRRSATRIGGRELLTARERDIVRLTVEGRTARQVGEELVISRRTVENHLASAYAKLAVGSKLELVRRAGELGLGRAPVPPGEVPGAD